MIFSIIVPVYNQEGKISRCLDSLKKIKYSEVEFIVVNDGSTDGTVGICQKYVDADYRFRLVNQENAGVSAARNTGIDYSAGKYIGFVDADDEITEKYNEIVKCLLETEYQLYCFDYCIQKKDEITICKKILLNSGLNNQKALYNSFLMGQLNSVWRNIYQADVIKNKKIKFTVGMKMGEDCEFNSKYLRYCSEIFYVDEICYKYYADDSGSATHQRKLEYLDDFERMYQSYLDIYHEEKGLEFPFDYELYMRYVYGIIKKNSNMITNEQNKKFRNGGFYKALMSKQYDDRKTNLKKLYIKWNIYRILK